MIDHIDKTKNDHDTRKDKAQLDLRTMRKTQGKNSAQKTARAEFFPLIKIWKHLHYKTEILNENCSQID